MDHLAIMIISLFNMLMTELEGQAEKQTKITVISVIGHVRSKNVKNSNALTIVFGNTEGSDYRKLLMLVRKNHVFRPSSDSIFVQIVGSGFFSLNELPPNANMSDQIFHLRLQQGVNELVYYDHIGSWQKRPAARILFRSQ